MIHDSTRERDKDSYHPFDMHSQMIYLHATHNGFWINYFDLYSCPFYCQKAEFDWNISRANRQRQQRGWWWFLHRTYLNNYMVEIWYGNKKTRARWWLHEMISVEISATTKKPHVLLWWWRRLAVVNLIMKIFHSDFFVWLKNVEFFLLFFSSI